MDFIGYSTIQVVRAAKIANVSDEDLKLLKELLAVDVLVGYMDNRSAIHISVRNKEGHTACIDVDDDNYFYIKRYLPDLLIDHREFLEEEIREPLKKVWAELMKE